MYPWYYVWSPRYRIFHEVLQFAVNDISGVSVRPLCMPQNIFDRKIEDASRHFLTGIGIKIYCLLKTLQTHTDEYIIFSDVDLIVPDKKLSEKLKVYETNDITAMREKKDGDEYNIGFMLIKNTPAVKEFFQTVLQRIQKEQQLDQDIFNQEIKQFRGTHGFFDVKDFIQSNMIRKDIWDSGNYSVIQCLSSEQTSKEVMLGKLATIIYFYNITHLLQFVDRDIIKSLQDYLYYQNPNHYLVSVDLNKIYEPPEQKVDSSAEQLPQDS
jgi:hypothetical protein